MELSRKTVGLIIGLLVISLAGLFWVQIYLLNNALAMKNRTLTRNVLSALAATTRHLESDEMTEDIFQMVGFRQPRQILRLNNRQFTPRDSARVDSITVHRALTIPFSELTTLGPDSLNHFIQINMSGAPSSEVTPLGDPPCFWYETHLIGDHSLAATQGTMAIYAQANDIPDSLARIIRSERFDLITRLVGDLSQENKVPVIERINMDKLGSILASHLRSVGISIDFSYGITCAHRDSIIFASNPKHQAQLSQSSYQARLFPMDMQPPFDNLIVFFPSERTFLLRQIWPILTSSIVFMLIIVVCFVLTIQTIFSQKRFADQIISFINNMTHEFKTPISTVALASEAIGRPEVVKEQKTVLRYNQMISDENKRMQKQVEKILQMAQLERGDFELNRDIIDCHELITKAARSFALQVEHRLGEITFALNAEQHTIAGDSLHLTNVVGNLLDNAIKYSPGPPRILITTKNRNGDLTIEVSDQGVGISSADKTKVFDKYFRCSTGDRHDIKGFGLGLSYVKLIVSEHNGQVGIESQPDEGTQVILRLPLAAARELI